MPQIKVITKVRDDARVQDMTATSIMPQINDDWELGVACDRNDPTCEACQ